MAATLSSSGDWTALSRSLPAKTEPNTPNADSLSPSDDFDPPPSEINQIVQLVADGYSTNHWTAYALLKHWLTAYGKDVPGI